MTLYELIGRIKDDSAPERIEIFDETFKYDKELKDYQDSDGDWLFQDYDWQSDLNTKLDNWVDFVITNCGNITFTQPRKVIEKPELIIEKNNIYTTNNKGEKLRVKGLDAVVLDKVIELIDEVNKINERV